MSTPAGGPIERQENWVQRHLGLSILLGCGTLLLLGLLFAGGLVALIMGSMRQSEVYKQALARAQQSPRVQQALGSPLQPGWFTSGNINVSGSSGDADLAIPVSGPKGKGTVYVVGKKFAGEWKILRLEVEVAGQAERVRVVKTPEQAEPKIEEQ